MFEQDGLSCHLSHTTRTEEFGEGNEQMDRQDQHSAHSGKLSRRPINTTLSLGRDSYEFATHTIAMAAMTSAYMVGDSESEIEMANRAVTLNPNSFRAWS